MFDGSRTQKRTRTGIVISSPKGRVWKFKCRLDPKFSNNKVEYQAMIMRLRILECMVTIYDHIQVKGDSQLVVKQIIGEY